MADIEAEPTVPARLLDDVRVSMKALLEQNVNAWTEVDRLHQQLRGGRRGVGADRGRPDTGWEPAPVSRHASDCPSRPQPPQRTLVMTQRCEAFSEAFGQCTLPAGHDGIHTVVSESEQIEALWGISNKALRLAEALYRAVEFEAGKGQAIEDEIKALYASLSAEDYLQNKQGAVYLDDDLMANLDQRAARNNIDRTGYLRWLLTGKAPTAEGQ